MKILIDAHASIQKRTGVGRYIDNLIRGLGRIKGVNLMLYTHSPMPEKYRKYLFYLSPFKNGLFRVLWGLNKASNKLKPNIVHINNFAPIFKTTPIVMTVHDLCFRTYPKKYNFKTRFAFWLFFSSSLKKADRIICVSESVRKELLRLYPVDPRKLSVIYEAADACFRPVSKNAAKRRIKRRFKITKPYFLVVGNIEPRKRPELIISAFSEFAKSHKNYQLVFAGPNLMGKKAGKAVKMLGFVEDSDLNSLYNGSESLIYASIGEGFGLPLVEAMNTKTPIIASDIIVFREIAKDSALYFRNKSELADSMLMVIKNNKSTNDYLKRGFTRGKFFSWSKAAKMTLEVYKRALGKQTYRI